MPATKPAVVCLSGCTLVWERLVTFSPCVCVCVCVCVSAPDEPHLHQQTAPSSVDLDKHTHTHTPCCRAAAWGPYQRESSGDKHISSPLCQTCPMPSCPRPVGPSLFPFLNVCLSCTSLLKRQAMVVLGGGGGGGGGGGRGSCLCQTEWASVSLCVPPPLPHPWG